MMEVYISKRPQSLRYDGPFYLGIIDNPQTDIWYRITPLGINSINHIMKKMISNSPLMHSDKHITNHSARKTVVKKLKKSRVQKSDIIGITGHSSEAGLDPYDSGDEVQQREYSHAIDSYQPRSSTNPAIKTFTKSSLPPRRFNFFSEDIYEKFSYSNENEGITSVVSNPMQSNPIMNFHNCTIYFGGQSSSDNNIIQKKRRRVIMSSDESSQEQ